MTKPATDLQPFIDAVQESLDRIKAAHRKRGDMVSALLDFQIVVGDLDDAIDRNERAEVHDGE